MPDDYIKTASKIPNVRFIDLGGVGNFHIKSHGGWQSKCRSILESSFDEVLWLDADCFPRVNPEFLFDSAFFKEYRAIFWNDLGDWEEHRKAVLSRVFQIRRCRISGMQFEAGQLLVSKNDCWRALNLCNLYNQHSDFVYKVVFGDKDTFQFAFWKTHTPYYLVPHRTQGGPGILTQFAPDGSKLFCHATQSKWSFSGRPLMNEFDMPHRAKCQEFIKEARQSLQKLRGLEVW
jgi:hypothetical protein